jgi:Tol biopolymer transport system component
VNRFATFAFLAALALAALFGLGSALAANATGRLMFDGCPLQCVFGRDEGVYVVNVDGGEPTRVASGRYASWSPDGTRLAFVRREDRAQDVYVVNADGSGELRLTNGLATALQSLSAQWAPDGNTLAAQVSSGQPLAIFLVAAGGGSVLKLADKAGGVTWSPDGSRLAYLQSRMKGGPELFVASAAGTGKRRIPLPRLVTGVAAGDRIAFVPKGSGVHVVKTDGSGLVRLADLPSEWAAASEPVWSPDGSRLAYSVGGPDPCWRCGAIPFRGREIYAFNADGTGEAVLTTDAGWLVSDINPAWSPDGTKIVFASTRVRRDLDGHTTVDLFQMNSDGSCETRLTNQRLLILSPTAWQPLAPPPVTDPYRCVDLRLDFPHLEVDPGGGYLDRDRIYSYTPEITNDGNLVATGVQLRYVIPDKMELVSVATMQGSCSRSAALVCDLGNLRPGATTSVVLRFRVPEPALLEFATSVSGAEPDNDPSYDNTKGWQAEFPFCRILDAPAAIVHGTSDGDLICGTTGADRIDSAGGNDELWAGAGDDHLDAGEGDDKVYDDGGDDEISGGSGRDRVFSEAGDDVVHGGDGDDFAFGGTGNDALEGGGGDDKLLGGFGRERITGGAGNDGLHAGEGNDLIEAGAGDDRIGRDSNVFRGDLGNDRVHAGDGDDIVRDKHGRDTIYGGRGNDTFHTIDWQPDRIICGPGHDLAVVDRLDRVHRSCERVVRRRVPRRGSQRGR